MNDLAFIQKTKNRGAGLFVAKKIKKGQLVVHGRGLYKVRERTIHSFQIDKKTYMQLDKISRSMNHSCEPNVGVKSNDCRGYDFIALRDINKGEEITWDYETTEYEVIWLKDCICGSGHCRRRIRGFKYLDQKTKDKYGEYIADYLKALN